MGEGIRFGMVDDVIMFEIICKLIWVGVRINRVVDGSFGVVGVGILLVVVCCCCWSAGHDISNW